MVVRGQLGGRANEKAVGSGRDTSTREVMAGPVNCLMRGACQASRPSSWNQDAVVPRPLRPAGVRADRDPRRADDERNTNAASNAVSESVGVPVVAADGAGASNRARARTQSRQTHGHSWRAPTRRCRACHAAAHNGITGAKQAQRSQLIKFGKPLGWLCFIRHPGCGVDLSRVADGCRQQAGCRTKCDRWRRPGFSGVSPPGGRSRRPVPESLQPIQSRP